jgi:hypothetical protein
MDGKCLVTRKAVYENRPLSRIQTYFTGKGIDAIFAGLEKWICKWDSRKNRH